MSTRDCGSFTLEELAYWAGFIDGEGTILISRNSEPKDGRINPVYSLRLYIASTDANVIHEAQRLFGGRIYEWKRTNPHHKNCFRLVFSGKKASTLLKLFVPYLKIKKSQAKYGIEFQEQKVDDRKMLGYLGSTPLSEKEILKRKKYYSLMKSLNKRGK